MLRAVGLTNEEEDVKFMLEGSQGDQVSGKISRAEVADLIAAALSSSATVGESKRSLSRLNLSKVLLPSSVLTECVMYNRVDYFLTIYFGWEGNEKHQLFCQNMVSGGNFV